MSNDQPVGVENLLYLLRLVAEDSAQLAANLITVNGLLLKMADRGEIETVMSVWYNDKNDLERQLQRNAVSTVWLRSQMASCLSIYYKSDQKTTDTEAGKNDSEGA